MFHFTKDFLSFRKEHPALLLGDISFIDTPQTILMFQRHDKDSQETLWVMFNLDKNTTTLKLPETVANMIKGTQATLNKQRDTIELDSFGWAILK